MQVQAPRDCPELDRLARTSELGVWGRAILALSITEYMVWELWKLASLTLKCRWYLDYKAAVRIKWGDRVLFVNARNHFKSLAGGMQVSFSSSFSQCHGTRGEVTKAHCPPSGTHTQLCVPGWLASYPLSDSLPDLTVLRLLTTSPQRTAKPLWKEQPNWLSESPIPMPGCAAKKMNRQLVCTLYLC